jgi:hypothetical protein
MENLSFFRGMKDCVSDRARAPSHS